MTLEELADLIRAISANTNGAVRVDRALAHRVAERARLMNIQNDLTDVGSEIAEVAATSTCRRS